MNSNEQQKQPDTLLLPFLQASDDAQAQHHLRHLLDECAAPIVNGVLRQKLGPDNRPPGAPQQTVDEQDREDLRAEIDRQILECLQKARSHPEAICDFGKYVAALAHNAFHRYLRQRHPQRYSLENKLCYLLQQRQELGLWRDDKGARLGGLAVWQQQRGTASSGRLEQLLADPHAFGRTVLARENPATMHPAHLLAALFTWVGHPIALEDLVRIVAVLWGVEDVPLEPPSGEEAVPGEHNARVPIAEQVIGRSELRRFWNELRQMPTSHCAALLLHARDPDGNSLVELLELDGIASLSQIAQVLELSAGELAALCQELPLDDAQIARRLGITAPYSARLRMIARQRLKQLLGV